MLFLQFLIARVHLGIARRLQFSKPADYVSSIQWSQEMAKEYELCVNSFDTMS